MSSSSPRPNQFREDDDPVDIELGVETVDELKGDASKKGSIKLMAVVLGLEDGTVEETVEALTHLRGVHGISPRRA